MRLIDADEAIINFGFEWDDIPPTREEFVRFLKKQPTVDAVPVVRCRECVGRPFWEKGHNDVPVCLLSGLYVKSEDDFCPYGDRKEGAD